MSMKYLYLFCDDIKVAGVYSDMTFVNIEATSDGKQSSRHKLGHLILFWGDHLHLATTWMIPQPGGGQVHIQL